MRLPSIPCFRGALLLFVLVLAGACTHPPETGVRPAAVSVPVTDAVTFWNSATVYFLLIDRFHNGDTGNDRALGRARDGALLRNFEGGDLAGLLHKIEEGYFDSLGVTAIWMTPFVEQIHAGVDEGTGKTYGYHGYWTRDWTVVDPAFGTTDDLRAVVGAAHRRGIRVLMDAVINHSGPPTEQDPAWPAEWVRTGPNCTYKSYNTTLNCTLVATLPDIRTDRDSAVELPQFLLEKWSREGRREKEVEELEAFFRRTGHPRAPRYYLMKWLTDWVRELGFDGYRIDTAKHFEPAVSSELKHEAQDALSSWRRSHSTQETGFLPFYMVGEVYGWEASQFRTYDFVDRKVDFFSHGYDALINFGFKSDTGSLHAVHTRHSAALDRGGLRGVSMLNYLSSHDDGSPYDRDRKDPFGAGTRLLLAPGGSQIYYGDELARPLQVPGAEGDANLRSFMNWEDLERGGGTRQVLEHWRKLGTFRRAHPAVGAGVHRTHQTQPYIFSRTLESGIKLDRVLVAMDQGNGAKTVPVFGVFADGTRLIDGYTGVAGMVRKGKVTLTTTSGLVLLAERR